MAIKVRFDGISLIRLILIRPFLHIKGYRYSPFSNVSLHWGGMENHNRNMILVEDGFIRSKGLGVHFSPPCSLVFDSRGIYFDARTESDLEYLLNYIEISKEELLRSGDLIEKLVRADITKYNVGDRNDFSIPSSNKVILVPGQVEDDASIKFGSPVLKDNLSLVKEVRKCNPDSFIIYKPHPDVVSSHRKGGNNKAICEFADLAVINQSITTILPRVDEVHTLTSLVGFEALLRGKKVITYGLPFYAGWGLTEDKLVCDRRVRRRSLEELVACALILYPTYWHPKKKCECEVEDVVEYIGALNDSLVKRTLTQNLLLKAKYIRDKLR